MEKKIIFLIILTVVLISTVTLIGYFVSKSDVLTPTIEVFGEDDGGPTTIYISLSIPPWLFLIYSLLFISIDLIIITILDTIKHIKKIEICKLRYKIISVSIVNLLLSIILIPVMIGVSTLITIGIVIFLFVKKKIREENDKNKEGLTA